MKSWLWIWILMSVLWIFSSQFELTTSSLNSVDKSVDYIWASYVAEASINKQLYNISTDDINEVNKFDQEKNKGVVSDSQYWFINEWADTWYFGAQYKNSTDWEINFGDTVGGDITIEKINNADYFNSLTINYNKTWVTNAKLLVTIAKTSINNNTRCEIEDYDGNACEILKTEINTDNNNLNGTLLDNCTIFFKQWDYWYNDKIVIQWFDPTHYNYRVTFNTINNQKINFSYYVENNWIRKNVVNNIVEIDTTGNAIDWFARIKLQKRITDEMSPLNKYVLFSNWEIAK